MRKFFTHIIIKFLVVDEENKIVEDSSKTSRFTHLMWVKMPVYLALERTRLWKELNLNIPLTEWLTEFYLIEKQLKSLKRETLNFFKSY